MEQMVDAQFGQHDRQQAIFEAVVVENIGERRRDDGAKTVIRQRPGRVLAAGAAAEVLARKQYARTLVARLIEHEVRIQRALRVVHAGFAHVLVTPGVE